eukprot:gene6490-13099_t
MDTLLCQCCRKPPVQPEIRYCGVCFEEGKVRKCCKSVFCDHCYTKGKMCPHCKNATKKDKTTGATFMVQLFSEHEECRICLDPGLKRRCCGQYYCDDCYYKLKTCRSCGKAVANRGLQMDFKDKATLCSVFLGWAVTAFLITALVGAITVITSSQLLTPRGISDFECFGFYSTCDVEVCISVDEKVAYGEHVALDPLSQWKYCTLNDTVKLEAKACVYDSALYTLSNKAFGYDVCSSQFGEGVYVFHEEFEDWDNSTSFRSNRMKSAKWMYVHNAKVDDACGTAVGAGALHFSGTFFRYATTHALDVTYGGWVEADLFISPVGYDITHPECKTSYQGGITVQYSVDHGESFRDLKYFASPTNRQEKFFPIKIPLPSAAWTNHTQIRFIQITFEDERDGWALDNVKVFHSFQSGWRERNEFRAAVRTTQEFIQHAQCCFDTEWCETRYSTAELESCKNIDGYKQQTFIFRQADIIICIVALVGLAKFIYVSIQNWLMFRRFPFNDEFDDLFKIDYILKIVPPRYRPRKNLKDLVSNVHQSARMVQNLQDALGDAPVEEDRDAALQRKQEEERQREDENKAKARKEKMKKKRRRELKKKMKDGNVSGNNFNFLLVTDLETAEEMVVMEESKFSERDRDTPDKSQQFEFRASAATMALTSVEDDIKRKNLAMRIPFDIVTSHIWRLSFFVITSLIFVVTFLFKTSSQKDYDLNAYVTAFGAFDGVLSLSSGGLLLFALACDFKELFHTLRYVVPVASNWTPLVTVDISEEISALFVGRNTIKLQDIKEAHLFTTKFVSGCAFAYFVGSLPWCMATLILRDQYLPYGYMRIVIPTIGGILVLRAILGPGIFLKVVFALQYVLDFRVLARQKIGSAFQTTKTYLASFHTALGVSIFGVFLCSAVAAGVAQYAFAVLLVGGATYGAFTGCIHSLPIRPWMVITTLKEGVWLRVKKEQLCPCVYRGRHCTELHQYEEIFVMFPREMLQFMSILKGAQDEAIDSQLMLGTQYCVANHKITEN